MEKEILEELILQGLSTRKIAKIVGRSQSNVSLWLRKHNLCTFKELKVQDIRSCLNCSTPIIKTSSNGGKYCDSKCMQEHVNRERIANWLQGDYNEKPQQIPLWIRKYLLDKSKCACSVCGWDKRHPADGLPLVEINHVDGDATNHCVGNLEVLCPNCHSLTLNFRARNKKSTRSSRN